MNGPRIRNARRLILAATVAVFAVLLCIIVAAMAVPGSWIEASVQGDPEISSEGLRAEVSCTVVVESSMPYDLDGVSVTVRLSDHERGSSVLLYSGGGITIPARSSAAIEIDASFSTLTAFLICRDSAADGDPLHFDVEVSCSYLLGLADFRLTAEIEVPVSSGDGISYEVVEDTDTAFSARATGLAEWLVPEGRSLTIEGGGETITVVLGSSGTSAGIAVRADSGIDAAFDAVLASEDFRVTDGSGKELEVERWQLEAARTVLDLARDAR